MISAVWNAPYLDDLYARWRKEPAALSTEWRAFFEGFELASRGPVPEAEGASELQSRAEALIHRYRDLGHLMACLDPLASCPTSYSLLEPASVGLTEADLDREIFAPDLAPGGRAPLREVLGILRETYCRSIGVEYLHLQDPDERLWLQGQMEPVRNRLQFGAVDAHGGASAAVAGGDGAADAHGGVSAAVAGGDGAADALRALGLLTRAGRFEEFLQRRYPGQTRFSLEGAEGALLLLEEVLRESAAAGAREVVLAMAHRGRLSAQVAVLGKSLEEAFCEFEASYDPEALQGGGDVKYHRGFVADIDLGTGPLRVVLPENPSHLEAVDPVAEGIARARQDRWGAEGPSRVLPLLVHGDASMSGQGIVAETLNLSRLEGYSTGGTVHVVFNNQIGYTTLPEHARSTRYATDVAKMLLVPIFHVHGEDPEALAHVARLAVAYRTRFRKDVVIDVLCYRRHGHNEGDEPYFTQPLMYQRIRGRPPLYSLYGDRLVAEGALARPAVEALVAEADRALEEGHQAARSQPCVWRLVPAWEGWDGIGSRYSHDPVETAVAGERLPELLQRLSTPPDGFRLHPTLRRVLDRRLEALEKGGGLDWAAAEVLAFATLLEEGVPVRLSGEDSRRGTFSQRHAAWFDTETGEPHVPLEHLTPNQGRFAALDSALSEAAVLGFEYGYAAADPNSLVLWEAQYGDFVNGAQVIVDQFIASGEAKWRRRSGVALLLPHGYEGQGPDHSTGRPERFLELCARDNLLVCVPSTPAQYFHLLRRQVKAPWRKPLVVFTPKSLLRHPAVVSPLAELASGGFREVLPDPSPPAGPARRVLLCTGKIYHELAARRAEKAAEGLVLLRLEQLHPFPAEQLASALSAHDTAAELCWVQEEPENMGAWRYLERRLRDMLGRAVRYVGRPEAASPATGFPSIHRQEQAALIDEALG